MTRSGNPIIFDTSDGQELRINMIGSWLRRSFGRKIVKLSLDGGFTCPNRDGSKGVGGCLFCSDSGSGDMASSLRSCDLDISGNIHTARASLDPRCPEAAESLQTRDFSDAKAGPSRTAEGVAAALEEQIRLLSAKWPRAGYIAYFQSHTNTYAPADHLRTLFETALHQPRVMGLAIATRSDCITDDALELLADLNQRTFLWVELGLQTIHPETARAMNLCHTLSDYDDALRRLSARGIRTVTHLILGLPGESPGMMLDSVRYVCRPLRDGLPPSGIRTEFPGGTPVTPAGLTSSGSTPVMPAGPASAGDGNHIFGLKLHMLNVVKGSGMAAACPDYLPFESIDQYTDLLIRALELVPPDITIHRISGDAPRSTLIAPEWSYRKRTILNGIHRTMRERNTWQGRLAE